MSFVVISVVMCQSVITECTSLVYTICVVVLDGGLWLGDTCPLRSSHPGSSGTWV